MIVLDLFCGLGGFSRAFKEAGHYVVGIDIVPPATILADMNAPPLQDSFRPDVLLASPPCTEFSREDMPWHRTWKKPDMALVDAAFKAIDTYKPRWWVIENTRGAVKHFPIPYTHKAGSRYLWTNIPLLGFIEEKCYGKWRLSPSKDRAKLRSEIPMTISNAILRAVSQ